MNFKKSLSSFLNKEIREIDYIKWVYKRRVQAEIESYEFSKDNDKFDATDPQDILMLNRISI